MSNQSIATYSLTLQRKAKMRVQTVSKKTHVGYSMFTATVNPVTRVRLP